MATLQLSEPYSRSPGLTAHARKSNYVQSSIGLFVPVTSKEDTALSVAIAPGCDNYIIERLLLEDPEFDEQEDPYPWSEATL
ncbi:hypothetical protein BDV12DRAFT_192305 [Aspergillus spectabilis]